MFQKIKEYVETNDHLVFILIDEVESLAHTRQSTGTDPSDAIRVVNALLTQIDNIKRYLIFNNFYNENQLNYYFIF